MTVAMLSRDWWRLPGCGDGCRPHSHDPYDHELHGRRLERMDRQRRVVRTGPLEVDLDRCTATVHGQEVMLTPREWELLAFYAERAGRWCSVDEVIGSIWVFGAATTVNTVRWRLRTSLAAAGALLEAQAGRGARRSRLRMEPVDDPQ